jgi:hypothetical protein
MSAVAEAPRDTPIEAIMANAQSSTSKSIAQSLPVNSDLVLRMGLQEKLGRPSKLLTAKTAARFALQNGSKIRPASVPVAAMRKAMHQAKSKVKAATKSPPSPKAPLPLVGYSGERDYRFIQIGKKKKKEVVHARQLQMDDAYARALAMQSPPSPMACIGTNSNPLSLLDDEDIDIDDDGFDVDGFDDDDIDDGDGGVSPAVQMGRGLVTAAPDESPRTKRRGNVAKECIVRMGKADAEEAGDDVYEPIDMAHESLINPNHDFHLVNVALVDSTVNSTILTQEATNILVSSTRRAIKRRKGLATVATTTG